MSDLVQRLRQAYRDYSPTRNEGDTFGEAADRIEALEKDNKDLIETLSGHDSDTEHMVAELAKRSNRIEALEAQVVGIYKMNTARGTHNIRLEERIEVLETALRKIIEESEWHASETIADIARRALEGK